MKLYINDISFRNDLEEDEPGKLVETFMEVCSRVKNYSFDKIYVPTGCIVKELAVGYSLNNFLLENPKNSLLHQKLKGIMVNQFVKIDFDDYAEEMIQYLKWNEQESEFLKRAFNSVKPTISFKTHPDFINHQIPVENQILDENEDIKITNGTVNNLSDLEHFTTLNEFLNQKQLEIAALQAKWDAIKVPIRFTERADQYLIDINYNAEFLRGNEHRKVGLAKMAGTYIAEMNGWEYKSEMSRRNNRRIFKALNQLVYLSIDTQHGTFELHDRNGYHCAEIQFNGAPSKGAQHNHDIEI